MQLLLCSGTPLYKDEDGIYYARDLTDKRMERYMYFFCLTNKVKVLTRVRAITSEKAKKSFSPVNFTVIECPNTESLKGIVFERFKIHKIIKETIQSADYVVVQMWTGSVAFAAIKEAILQKKPYFIECVSCTWDALWNYNLKGKLIAPIMYMKVKLYIRNAAFVYYVTNEFLQRRYPTKGFSIGCSNVIIEATDECVLEKRLRKIICNNTPIIIGTTGAIDVRYKGQQYVIQALGKLKKLGVTNYRYQLVGGMDDTYLRNVAMRYDVLDQVEFMGSVPHEKVFEWLDSIDIYVQPSRQEGLPRSLIEAMSRGLPAFGARTAGIPELINYEFIFSNTNRNIKEIIDILNRFTPEIMLQQAKRNYEVAKKYEQSTLKEKRSIFFKEFINHANANYLKHS